MQVGCGVYSHRVRGKPYLYFWHYETESGSRVQVKEYVGPAGDSRTRADAARRCEAYYVRVADSIGRLRAATMARISASGG